MRAPSRKDVAERAGVSETIVSYVINNNRPVSQEKRERVLKAVKELNYRPNSSARALKGKSNRHILFIAEKIENEYFGRLVREIDQCAYDRGYMVSLMAARNNQEFIQRIISRTFDAVVISSASIDESYVQQLIDAGIPVVLLMNRDYGTLKGEFARIYTGNESGIMHATRMLVESGCRCLCYVDRVSQNNHFSDRRDMRYRGFCNQMEAMGMKMPPYTLVSQCRDYEALHRKVCALIEEHPEIDGFVCRNDHLACVVMSAVHSMGKSIPEEICIVGFDNSSMCTVVQPALSSIDFDRHKISAAIIEMIESMVEGGNIREQHFATNLVLRGSTRPDSKKES